MSPLAKTKKVLMFVARRRGGRVEFLIIRRQKQKDVVAPTGHVEKGETPAQAALRETEEEVGLKPLKLIDLKYNYSFPLSARKQIIDESAFLVFIPYRANTKYLESDDPFEWVSLDTLVHQLTYSDQRRAAKKIKRHL